MGLYRIVAVDQLAGDHRVVGGGAVVVPDRDLGDVMRGLADAAAAREALAALLGGAGANLDQLLGLLGSFGQSEGGIPAILGRGDGILPGFLSLVSQDNTGRATPAERTKPWNPRADDSTNNLWNSMLDRWFSLTPEQQDFSDLAGIMPREDDREGRGGSVAPKESTPNVRPNEAGKSGVVSPAKPDKPEKPEKPEKPVKSWDPDEGPTDAQSRALIAMLPAYLQAQESSRHRKRTSSGQGPDFGPDHDGTGARDGGYYEPGLPLADQPSRPSHAAAMANAPAVLAAARRIRAGFGPGAMPGGRMAAGDLLNLDPTGTRGSRRGF